MSKALLFLLCVTDFMVLLGTHYSTWATCICPSQGSLMFIGSCASPSPGSQFICFLIPSLWEAMIWAWVERKHLYQASLLTCGQDLFVWQCHCSSFQCIAEELNCLDICTVGCSECRLGVVTWAQGPSSHLLSVELVKIPDGFQSGSPIMVLERPV